MKRCTTHKKNNKKSTETGSSNSAELQKTGSDANNNKNNCLLAGWLASSRRPHVQEWIDRKVGSESEWDGAQ